MKTRDYESMILPVTFLAVLVWLCQPMAWPPKTGGISYAQRLAQVSAPGVREIIIGSRVVAPFSMGVNSSKGLTGWLQKQGDHFKMAYPARQDWGAVFITVGAPTNNPAKSIDLSSYMALAMDLEGEHGGETVDIGIRDVTQPADGSETKLGVTLTGAWKTYRFPLASFTGADRTKLYIVCELVFPPQTPETIYFRNVKYLRRGVRTEQ